MVKKEDKRPVINTVRNVINLVLIIVLFALWSGELQKFALSIAAFVVAIVLATKEIIQCVIGFIYLSSTNPFRVGDWVQTDSYTGEVSSTDWAKVTLLEVDIDGYEYTGKSIFIPNSQLITQSIKNLNFMRRYVNHSFTLVKDNTDVNPFTFKRELLKCAANYCDDFKEVGERYNTLIENRLDIKLSGPEPSLKITTTELGKIKATFNIFCPTKRAQQLEQKITQDFFNMWNEEQRKLLLQKKPDKQLAELNSIY